MAGSSSAGAVGGAGVLFGAELVGGEGAVDSAPDVAVESSPDVGVGGESEAGALGSVGVVEGDAGACCWRRSPPVAVSEPRVVPPDRSEPPTRADTGLCPISSTVVTTTIASPNTATPVAATIAQRRQRRRGGLRRGSRWAGSGGRSLADRSTGDCGDRTSRLPAMRSPAWVRRMDSV